MKTKTKTKTKQKYKQKHKHDQRYQLSFVVLSSCMTKWDKVQSDQIKTVSSGD